MEHAFSVMLRELTTDSHTKLAVLTQSAQKLRPAVVARVVRTHLQQSPVEALPAALQLSEKLCLEAGPSFKGLFESELPELFEMAWSRSDRDRKNQILKLFVSWKSTLSAEVISTIDARMKTSVATKRGSESTPVPSKRHKHAEEAPVPMYTNNPPYWILQPSASDDEVSDGGDGEGPSVISLFEMLIDVAQKCRPSEGDEPMTSVRTTVPPDYRHLHVFDDAAYGRLVKGTKTTRPRRLDWRFRSRFEKRKQGCRSRAWYARSEIWAQESDPKDLSPQQLMERLSKPRSWKTDDVMRVTIDDARHQTRCAISGDLLELGFDDRSGKWHYLRCRRLTGDEAVENGVGEGAVCLADCVKHPQST